MGFNKNIELSPEEMKKHEEAVEKTLEETLKEIANKEKEETQSNE